MDKRVIEINAKFIIEEGDGENEIRDSLGDLVEMLEIHDKFVLCDTKFKYADEKTTQEFLENKKKWKGMKE